MTQADSAYGHALGMSLDGADDPAPPTGFPHGNSDTHTEIPNDPAEDLRRGDIIYHTGQWRTISVVIKLRVRELVAIYFAESKDPTPANGHRALFPKDQLFTVYRPKGSVHDAA